MPQELTLKKRAGRAAVSAVQAIWFLLSPVHAALPVKSYLPSDTALDLARAAVAACASRQAAVAAVVVDVAGGLRVLIAADGVKAIDIESARRKARTAAILADATSHVAAGATAAPAYGALLLNLDPALLLLPGGVPILAGADQVGAIGVGGAKSGADDEACAVAGLAALRLTH